jgi:hypothetical protein
LGWLYLTRNLTHPRGVARGCRVIAFEPECVFKFPFHSWFKASGRYRSRFCNAAAMRARASAARDGTNSVEVAR